MATEDELMRGHGADRPGGLPEAPPVTRARAVIERENATTRALNALADLLEDARPLIKRFVEELDRERRPTAHRPRPPHRL